MTVTQLSRLRMIGAGLVRYAQIGAKKGGSQFGDEFFHRIGGIAETLAELAVTAALHARPTRQTYVGNFIRTYSA